MARLVLAGVLAGAAALAQVASPSDLAAGKFLVARKDLPDPNFFESVILLIQYDAKGAMGLVINHRSDVPLSQLFSEMKEARGRTEPAFVGGPVMQGGALALVRSAAKTEDARAVIEDVYMISSRASLPKMLAGSKGADTVRVYLGYSGWGPRQLDREVEWGTWHILRADARSVFDPDPVSLWKRLSRKTNLEIALGLRVAR